MQYLDDYGDCSLHFAGLHIVCMMYQYDHKLVIIA
jgi:hypothetical protein